VVPPVRPFGRRAALAALLLLTSPALAKPQGRPKVTLDSLVLPADVANARELERHLKRVLGREARRADWGAGSSARIEYRFIIEELAVTEEHGVLRVRCTALGRLPKGKSARSRLEYGGAPARRSEEVKKVLEIVARGVMTRLAELERHRRSSAR
jgi:hypothetical protein